MENVVDKPSDEGFEFVEDESNAWAYVEAVLVGDGGWSAGDGVACGEFKADKEFEPCDTLSFGGYDPFGVTEVCVDVFVVGDVLWFDVFRWQGGYGWQGERCGNGVCVVGEYEYPG